MHNSPYYPPNNPAKQPASSGSSKKRSGQGKSSAPDPYKLSIYGPGGPAPDPKLSKYGPGGPDVKTRAPSGSGFNDPRKDAIAPPPYKQSRVSHKSPPAAFSKQASQYAPPINQSFQPQNLSHYGPQHPPPHAAPAPRQQQKKQQVPSHYQPQPQQIHHQIPDQHRYPAPANSNFQQHTR